MSGTPVLLIVAGPNGSGKTSLTQQLRADGLDLGYYINPDDIARQLVGDYREQVAAAQRIADRLREDCLERRQSFSFETVMSHPSKIDILQRARRLGYTNVLYFVCTESPALNIARVRQRVSQGGHDVPEERIVERYKRTLALLPEAIAACDRAVLYDNTYRASGESPVIMTPFCAFDRQLGLLRRQLLMEPDDVPHWAREVVQALE